MYISFCQHRPICRISGPDKQDSRHRIPKTTTADAILRQILLLMAHLLRRNSALSGLFFQLDLSANSAGEGALEPVRAAAVVAPIENKRGPKQGP